MAYGNNSARINRDRFGNPYQLKTALKSDKWDGYKCHVELGGKLYAIEISQRQKEHKSGKEGMWVKITAKPKQNRASSM